MSCFKLAPMIAFQRLMSCLAIKEQTGHSVYTLPLSLRNIKNIKLATLIRVVSDSLLHLP